MPAPEHAGEEPHHEAGQDPWYQARRYKGEHDSARPYAEVQAAIYRHECDLSAYRLNLDTVWHVAVLGEKPTEAVIHVIERILSTGEATSLPDEVLEYLSERRKQAQQVGPWVEGHYGMQGPRIPIGRGKQGTKKRRR